MKAEASNESGADFHDMSNEPLEAKIQDNTAGKVNTLVTVDLENIIGAKDCIMLCSCCS